MSVPHIFIITRFSIFNPNMGVSWSKRDLDIEAYRAELYSESRLDLRFFLFENLCLASLKDQHIDGSILHFLVVTSEDMPSQYQQKLHDLLDPCETASFRPVILKLPKYVDAARDPVPVEGARDAAPQALNQAVSHYISSVLEQPDSSEYYATVRLDDDDGFARDFCSVLSGYPDGRVVGIPISFCKGLQAEFDPVARTLRDVRECWVPKIAQGLSLVDRYVKGSFAPAHIHQKGAHTRIDEAGAVIYDDRFYAYLMTAHRDNHSRRLEGNSFASLPAARKHAMDGFGSVGIFSPDMIFGSETVTKVDCFPPYARLKNRYETYKTRHEASKKRGGERRWFDFMKRKSG